MRASYQETAAEHKAIRAYHHSPTSYLLNVRPVHNLSYLFSNAKSIYLYNYYYKASSKIIHYSLL